MLFPGGARLPLVIPLCDLIALTPRRAAGDRRRARRAALGRARRRAPAGSYAAPRGDGAALQAGAPLALSSRASTSTSGIQQVEAGQLGQDVVEGSGESVTFGVSSSIYSLGMICSIVTKWTHTALYFLGMNLVDCWFLWCCLGTLAQLAFRIN